MRKVKILGLALVAMLAIGATTASVSSAAFKLTAESYPVTLTGASDEGIANQVSTTAGSIACPNSAYHGTVAAASSSVSITPSFSGCSVFGIPGSFQTNGCSLLLKAVGEATPNSTIDIVCPAGVEMTITAGEPTNKCTAHIKPQTGLGTVTVTSVGSGATRELTLDVNVTGISYTHTKGSGLGACTSGSATNGTLTAKTRVTAEGVGGTTHVGIFPSF